MIRHPAPPRVEPPAGLAHVGELGEPWAGAAWHHAVAIAAGWRGDAPAWTPWGYPPPIPYAAVPAPRGPYAAPMPPTRPEPTPRRLPTPSMGIA